MRYRQLRLCSDRGGYEAVPDRPVPIDLGPVRRAFEKAGVAVVDARVLLIVGTDPEVTISRSGRLLFKTRDREAAVRAFERVRSLLGGSNAEGGAL